ncbi:MAG: hypothetical protein J6D37_03860 [Clostridia bacterium]|nr:hypothetical protein [Clostridia bacterium]
MKEFFKNKKFGFYVTLALVALFIITAIVYSNSYGNTAFMSWPAFIVLLVGAGLTVVLVALKQDRFAPALALATSVVALCLYILDIYYFISSIAYGIQFSGIPVELIATMVLFIGTMIVAIANIFFPQVEE